MSMILEINETLLSLHVVLKKLSDTDLILTDKDSC